MGSAFRRHLRWAVDERWRLVHLGSRYLRERIIRFTRLDVARRLRFRADAARDLLRYDLAATLYEEALRFVPGDQRLHVQAGHMYKEGNDLERAEMHYRKAERIGPRTADLVLQLGHFCKVAGRVDEAGAAYTEALELRPGWQLPADELRQLGLPPVGSPERPLRNATGAIVGELLPHGPRTPPGQYDAFHLKRLGVGRARARYGTAKILRGIEAIHGSFVSAAELTTLQILVDGKLFHAEPLYPFDIEGAGAARRKYCFNAWCDFSSLPPGDVLLDLLAIDTQGRVIRKRQEKAVIVLPLPEAAHPQSDALVALPAYEGPIEQAINARPSMVRPAERHLLREPVRTVLVQRVDQLGDMVCSLPAVERLRSLFPAARVIGLRHCCQRGPRPKLRALRRDRHRPLQRGGA